MKIKKIPKSPYDIKEEEEEKKGKFQIGCNFIKHEKEIESTICDASCAQHLALVSLHFPAFIPHLLVRGRGCCNLAVQTCLSVSILHDSGVTLVSLICHPNSRFTVAINLPDSDSCRLEISRKIYF